MSTSTNTEFSKYNSIEKFKTNNSKQIKAIKAHITNETEFFALEKIHGCNFSITLYKDDTGVITYKWGKRNSYLSENEEQTFYSAHYVIDKYSNACVNLFKDYISKNQNTEKLVIYGELFGGNYNHKDVENNTSYKMVQKEIQYTPYIEWIVFDIISFEDNDPQVLKYTDVIELCVQFNIPVIKPFAIGTFDEMIEINPTFNTMIPELFGLPKIEPNIAEGFIVRPNVNIIMRNGKRLILKIKNTKFLEQNNNIQSVSDTTDYSNIEEVVNSYITKNRCVATVSKFGPDENIGVLINFYLTDICDDIEKDFPELYEIVKKILIPTSKNDKKNKNFKKIKNSVYEKINTAFTDYFSSI